MALLKGLLTFVQVRMGLHAGAPHLTADPASARISAHGVAVARAEAAAARAAPGEVCLTPASAPALEALPIGRLPVRYPHCPLWLVNGADVHSSDDGYLHVCPVQLVSDDAATPAPTPAPARRPAPDVRELPLLGPLALVMFWVPNWGTVAKAAGDAAPRALALYHGLARSVSLCTAAAPGPTPPPPLIVWEGAHASRLHRSACAAGDI